MFTALDLIPHWSFVINALTDHLSLISAMAPLSCNMRPSSYRLDAETRRNAVNALTEIGLRLLLSYSHATTTAKTSPKPDDEMCSYPLHSYNESSSAFCSGHVRTTASTRGATSAPGFALPPFAAWCSRRGRACEYPMQETGSVLGHRTPNAPST